MSAYRRSLMQIYKEIRQWCTGLEFQALGAIYRYQGMKFHDRTTTKLFVDMHVLAQRKLELSRVGLQLSLQRIMIL